MQSHDFASTYVGTPFYMSPEICAAEKYTLHSDIWSLGCIMYELCTRQPPFNAKTHFHLVQKIKEGRFDIPIPSIYSPELQNVIKSCLKTNPSHRPDTATLIQLPVVRLMRKEREVVELGRILKVKADEAEHKATKLQLQISALDMDKENAHFQIESTVRREWEVKARLEIDRQIQLEADKLQKKFETELQSRVQFEVERHLQTMTANSRPTSSAHTPNDIPLSSVSTNNDTDFPSTTDITSLSLDSPLPTSQSSKPLPIKRSSRTPFARARTTYDSPMDIHMTSPSPMSINSLALSPRRTGAPASTFPNPQNLFAIAAEQRARWEPHLLSTTDSEDESLPLEDEEEEEEGNALPNLPSPSRVPKLVIPSQDPFKLPVRQGLRRQNTAPIKPLGARPSLFTAQAQAHTSAPIASNMRSRSPPLAPTGHPLAQPKPTSPNCRLSKVPFLADGAGSPTRKLSVKRGGKAAGGGEEMFKAVTSRNMLGGAVGGRTLVELQQGRVAAKEMEVGAKEMAEEDDGVRMVARVVDMEREKDVVTWDPERDEMPSPFLARKGRAMR